VATRGTDSNSTAYVPDALTQNDADPDGVHHPAGIASQRPLSLAA
jgi:hypothetical protein